MRQLIERGVPCSAAYTFNRGAHLATLSNIPNAILGGVKRLLVGRPLFSNEHDLAILGDLISNGDLPLHSLLNADAEVLEALAGENAHRLRNFESLEDLLDAEALEAKFTDEEIAEEVAARKQLEGESTWKYILTHKYVHVL